MLSITALKKSLKNKSKRPLMIKSTSYVCEIPFNHVTKTKVSNKRAGLKQASRQGGPLASLIPKFHTPGSLLIVEKGRTINSLEEASFRTFTSLLQPEAPDSKPMDELIDLSHLFDHLLFDRIDSQTSEDIIHKASRIHLPVSDAHGDLHTNNIVFTKSNERKLIDWEHYKEQSSYVLDLFHLLLRKEGMKRKVSWTEVIKLDVFDHPDFQKILDRHQLTLHDVIFAYALNRIYLEGRKKMACEGFLKHTEVEKFKEALLYCHHHLIKKEAVLPL